MIDEAAHRSEVEAWRAEHYQRLRQEIGWLTLAGLGWLRPGLNRVGSDPAADVVLPSGPAHAGTVEVGPDGAVASGAWLHQGAPVERLRLASDAEADEATLLELGALRLCLIDRGGRLALRTWDTASPALTAFDGIDHWPIDPAWRVEARFEPRPGRRVTVPDVIGVDQAMDAPGDVVLQLGDGTHRLQALDGGPGGDLWLVFGDATNGVETYAGGRFLYTAPPAADGSVLVDFNRAYNPPCVFSPFATCPLPWPANRLPIRVEAGERAFHPAHHPAR